MESQDNVGTGAEISTENDVPAIFYDGSDGVPQSGAPQREIYQSELAQSQEDIARLTRPAEAAKKARLDAVAVLTRTAEAAETARLLAAIASRSTVARSRTAATAFESPSKKTDRRSASVNSTSCPLSAASLSFRAATMTHTLVSPHTF